MNQALCQAYLQALNESDLTGVLALFSDDAVVVSPLYGEIKAGDFYRGLFADTEKSETHLLNIFDSSGEGNNVALHFRYIWTLQSGDVVDFEVVDVFELTADQQRFSKLTIIYDTYPVRQPHKASQQQSANR